LKFFRITGKSFLDFFRDDGLMLAGAMSYFSMMALLPFCLFLITLFGYFLGHYHEFYRFFLTKLVNFFPSVTHEVTDELLKLISYKGIGKFSLVLYGLLSYQVFASLEKALNVIFKVKIQRHFFSSLLISLLVVTSIITLLITSFAAASFIHLFKTFQILELSVEISRMNEIIIGFALPFILVLLTVTMIYMLMPKTRVRFADAFKGAFFCDRSFGGGEASLYMVCRYCRAVRQDIRPTQCIRCFSALGILYFQYFFNRCGGCAQSWKFRKKEVINVRPDRENSRSQHS